MKKIKAFFNGVWSVFLAVFLLLKKVWKHKRGKVGIILTSTVILIAIFAPFLTPYSPYEYDLLNGLQPPSSTPLLGTDKNGVDILTQLLYGARVSLIIGIVTGISVTLFGAIMGVIAGYFGKVASGVILNLINVLMVIPTMPLMIMLNGVSSSYLMMIAIFIMFGWSGTARIVRSQVLSIKNMQFVKQAELAGASKWYVMYKHILPNISNILIMGASLSCAGFMLAEAGLSFIGLGDPSVISWGKILMSAQESAFISSLWAWVLAPGVALFIVVTGFMQIGFALEDIFNPRIRMQNEAYKTFYKTTQKEIDDQFEKMEDMSLEEATKLLLGEKNER